MWPFEPQAVDNAPEVLAARHPHVLVLVCQNMMSKFAAAAAKVQVGLARSGAIRVECEMPLLSV
eukprot:5950527-Amphidinium_carterae.1